MAEIYWSADNIATIAGFLSAAECEDYVRLGEATGFEEAPITTSRGMILMKDVRNNDRVMIDDPERALALYRKLSGELAPRFERTWTPVGFNERLRLYRYDVGQQFDWHRDGYFQRPNGERSFFTFMVYLNDDYEGGATSFSDNGSSLGRPIRITPAMGMGLLFHHPIVHRGDPVVAGRKYVLRTDVMYRRVAAT
ncbi:2OG-Fe(II) oxygenase [Bradyrhizobium manausense]|uniref:2OG-Fe(II) oxygenase n=1 Tax=Bradyrhizobium TaxID=374 RepID=UPI001BA837A5|nr:MULTISPECIES: 2OG-Fe(II) oxygenase [Bradyrhizobium]MBR0826865.1 2OG-Fe(II) oxygenase [Bradyrhizobium manausense]UVO32148.1 2OG-Fe(II) oxygenase [Bradyrhizobium arachidis]